MLLAVLDLSELLSMTKQITESLNGCHCERMYVRMYV